jgi:hypothetical protein
MISPLPQHRALLVLITRKFLQLAAMSLTGFSIVRRRAILAMVSAPMAAAAQRLKIAAPTPTSVSRLVERAAAITSTPVRRTGTAAGAIAHQLTDNAARRATTVLMVGGVCCTPANSIAAMDLSV